MYLWAALFSSLVVGLSVLRISLVWFAVITVGAIGALVLATAPKLRPWHSAGPGKRERARGSRTRSDDPLLRHPGPRRTGRRAGTRRPAARGASVSQRRATHGGVPAGNGAHPGPPLPNRRARDAAPAAPPSRRT